MGLYVIDILYYIIIIQIVDFNNVIYTAVNPNDNVNGLLTKPKVKLYLPASDRSLSVSRYLR